MWAILGDIEFEVLGSPVGMEHHFAAEFAQHALISKKPRIEAIGSTLDEISLDIKLHYSMGEVEERLRMIREALVAQEPLALVMGDGDYRGPWVLTDGVVVAQKTTDAGRLVSATLKLSLLEYTGEFTPPEPRPGIADGPVQPETLTAPPGAPTSEQELAGYARDAENAVRNVQSLVTEAQALIANPLAALQAMPGVISATTQALVPAQALELVSGAAGLVQFGKGLAADISAARNALMPPDANSLSNQLQVASDSLGRGMQRIADARPSVLKLTADVAMRKV